MKNYFSSIPIGGHLMTHFLGTTEQCLCTFVLGAYLSGIDVNFFLPNTLMASCELAKYQLSLYSSTTEHILYFLKMCLFKVIENKA